MHSHYSPQLTQQQQPLLILSSLHNNLPMPHILPRLLTTGHKVSVSRPLAGLACFTEVISPWRITWAVSLKIVSCKCCGPKINKLSQCYCPGGVFMHRQSVIYDTVQSASGEDVTNSNSSNNIVFSQSVDSSYPYSFYIR